MHESISGESSIMPCKTGSDACGQCEKIGKVGGKFGWKITYSFLYL